MTGWESKQNWRVYQKAPTCLYSLSFWVLHSVLRLTCHCLTQAGLWHYLCAAPRLDLQPVGAAPMRGGVVGGWMERAGGGALPPTPCWLHTCNCLR